MNLHPVQYVCYLIHMDRSCKKCKGKKTVKEKKRQEIFIEKGMTDRQRIVLSGEGDQSVCSHPSVTDFYVYNSLL